MDVAVFVIAVVLCQSSFAVTSNVRSITRSTGNGSDKLDLLEVIKLNLRKNNDDYAERVKLVSLQTGVPIYTKRVYNRRSGYSNGIDNKVNIGDNINVVDEDSGIRSESLIYNIELEENKTYVPKYSLQKQPVPIPTLKHRINVNVNKSILELKPKKPIQSNITVLTTTATMKVFSQSNKNRMKSFKEFISKNKDLFNEYVGGKKSMRINNDMTDDQGAMKLDIKSFLEGNVKHRVGHIMSGEDNLQNGPVRGDMLDMVKAKGGRIHVMRMKSHLCHRHVLIPEGPKYNSKGEIYLAAHADNMHSLYNVTRRPRMLLPRCCNCCKKSVLGCM